jgi:hypothetical protein
MDNQDVLKSIVDGASYIFVVTSFYDTQDGAQEKDDVLAIPNAAMKAAQNTGAFYLELPARPSVITINSKADATAEYAIGTCSC